MSRSVAVVSTGVANLASVLAGLHRAGAGAHVERDPAAVAAAAHVMLPGVGAFGPGMQELRTSGLAEVLIERVRAGRPTLAICLGLQLLCRRSAESPGVPGLGCIDGDVEPFPNGVRSPQFGWNRVHAGPGCRLLQDGYAYFANSYRLAEPPAGWCAATAEHGAAFVAALERGAVLACQFHPELSGSWGGELLQRWLQSTA